MDPRTFSLGNPRRRPAEPAQPELALPVDPLSVPIPPRAGWSQVDRNTLAWVHPILGWTFALVPDRYPGTAAAIYPASEGDYKAGGPLPYVYTTAAGAERRLTALGVHLGTEFETVHAAIDAIRRWYGSLRFAPVPAQEGAGHAARPVAPARGAYVRVDADHNHLGPGVVTYEFATGESLVHHLGTRVFERHAPGTLVRAVRPRWLDHITVEARPRDVGGWQLTVGADGREVAVLNVRDAREALDVADRFALGSVGDGALTARVFVEGREVSARTRDDGGTRANGWPVVVAVGSSVDAKDPVAGPGVVTHVDDGVTVYHPKLKLRLWHPAQRVFPVPWPQELDVVDVNAWEDNDGNWHVTMWHPTADEGNGDLLAETPVGGEAEAGQRAEAMARGALASGAAEASVYDSGLLVRYLQPER